MSDDRPTCGIAHHAARPLIRAEDAAEPPKSLVVQRAVRYIIGADVLPHFRLRPVNDRMQVAFVSMPDARFDQFPIGTLAGFRVADASDNDAPSAAVFF